MYTVISYAAHYLLLSLAWTLSKLPNNSTLWCYTIMGKDGSPYLTRILLPRWRGERRMIHYIRRADADRDMHNHPWREARGRILLGGYLEERRLTDEQIKDRFGSGRIDLPNWRRFEYYESRWYLPGDRTELDATTFHRVAQVKPRTWTTLVVGERTGDEWGFLDSDSGDFIPWPLYFRRKGLPTEKGKNAS